MKSTLLKRIDWVLMSAFLPILLIGFLVLFSATHKMGSSGAYNNYLVKQIVWACLGLMLIVLLGFVNYGLVGNVSIVIYGINVFLLIFVIFFGHRIGGAKRWISLGAFSIQPSEFMKLTLILYLSWFLAMSKGKEGKLFTLVMCLGIAGFPLLLILKEPDLGTSIVFIPILFTLMFVYGMRLKYLVILILSGLLSSPVFWLMLKPYQKSRVLVFLNPGNYKYGAGWSVIQSKIAVGSGRILGKGWLEGSQAHLNFLPEHHTDFIFSVLAEEAGFVGCSVLLALYLVVLLRGIQISIWARDDFGRYMACGIVAMIACHIVVNIGMTIGLLPVTGLPLPFMSYGGSFLITMILSIGFLFKIYAKGTECSY